jgi:hypothetical protein
MRSQRLVHFLVLIVMLTLGVGVFYYVAPNRTLQMASGIATSVGYMLWGIIHHHMEGDLAWRLVIEYVLIGTIAIVLLLTMSA